MTNKILSLPIIGILAATAAVSEERIELNNVYPLNQEYFQLSDRTYLTQDHRGYFEVIEGPFEQGPARCVGAGFGMRDDVNSIEGICIFGEGNDAFTMRWKAGEQGAANTWAIVDGTGKFNGMTGEDIATTGVEIMYRAMPLRQSNIVGTVTIPPN